MNYFILDETRLAGGTRSTTYINLIGGLDAKRFWVYYEGKILNLARSHKPSRLRVVLKSHGTVVAAADVLDLTRRVGTVAVNKRLIVECAVTMRDVDAVDARIQP